MAPESGDPTDIRALTVTGEDLVAAVEMNRTRDRKAVLRITPPFSGRMRARLHVVQETPPVNTPRPVHVDPETLLGPETPPYPRPSETEDELRADPDEEYTVDRHRDYHAAAVADWREMVRTAASDRVTLDTHAGETTVDVHILD